MTKVLMIKIWNLKYYGWNVFIFYYKRHVHTQTHSHALNICTFINSWKGLMAASYDEQTIDQNEEINNRSHLLVDSQWIFEFIWWQPVETLMESLQILVVRKYLYVHTCLKFPTQILMAHGVIEQKLYWHWRIKSYLHTLKQMFLYDNELCKTKLWKYFLE